MKKIIAVLLMAAVAFTVSGCGKEEGENSSSQTSDTASQVSIAISEENTVSSALLIEGMTDDYMAFLTESFGKSYTKDDIYFALKDIDGNGVYELILKEELVITVYTYNSTVKKLGSHDFKTGTLRLLYSDNPSYPGIIYFYVGGGSDHYEYLSTDNKTLTFEKLWNENYAFAPVGSPDRITEISPDKQLIQESKTAYEKNNDIEFMPLSDILR